MDGSSENQGLLNPGPPRICRRESQLLIEGVDFLQKNAALAEEVRRTLVDLDEVEKELKKASKAIDAVTGLTGKYRVRLQVLCENSHPPKTLREPQQKDDIPQMAGA